MQGVLPLAEHSPPQREELPGKRGRLREEAGEGPPPPVAADGPDSPVIDAMKNAIAAAWSSVSVPITPVKRRPDRPVSPDSARTVYKAPGDPILGQPTASGESVGSGL